MRHKRQPGIAIGGFGEHDARQMPIHLFWGADLDYATAVRADIAQQDFTVCPRHWYVDATLRCARCSQSFVFSADQQRFWYEQLRFWVDSRAKHCTSCRQELRRLKALRHEYDREVAAALARLADMKQKKRLVTVLDALDEGGVELPEQLKKNRRVLSQQIERLGGNA